MRAASVMIFGRGLPHHGMKGLQMKEIVILQIGEVVGEQCRYLRVQVPDDMDTAAFDEYELCVLLEELADESGVPWEDYEDCTTFANRCLIEDADLNPEDWANTPVLQISSEMVTKAMAEGGEVTP